jgi:hypothetical protein
MVASLRNTRLESGHPEQASESTRDVPIFAVYVGSCYTLYVDFFFLPAIPRRLYNAREAQDLPLAAYFKVVAFPWPSLLRSNT